MKRDSSTLGLQEPARCQQRPPKSLLDNLSRDVQRMIATFVSGGTVRGALDLPWPLDEYRLDPLLCDAILPSMTLDFAHSAHCMELNDTVFWITATFDSCTPVEGATLCDKLGAHVKPIETFRGHYFRMLISVIDKESRARVAAANKQAPSPSVILNPTEDKLHALMRQFIADIIANKPLAGVSELDKFETHMIMAASIGFRAYQSIPCIFNAELAPSFRAVEYVLRLHDYACIVDDSNVGSALVAEFVKWSHIMRRIVSTGQIDYLRGMDQLSILIDACGEPLLSAIRSQNREMQDFIIAHVDPASKLAGFLVTLNDAVCCGKFEIADRIASRVDFCDLLELLIKTRRDFSDFILHFRKQIATHRNAVWERIFIDAHRHGWQLGADGIKLIRDPIVGPSSFSRALVLSIKDADKWNHEIIRALELCHATKLH
jgi:hypothetical protein